MTSMLYYRAVKYPSTRSIFITGASGFVGANIARAYVAKGYDVHLLLRHTKNLWRLTDILSRVSVHAGSLLDEKKLRKTIQSVCPTYIIHCAAHGAYSTQNNLDEILSANIEGTKNLLQATQDIPYVGFINTGTSSEYGIKKFPMKETDSCEPISYYAFTKLAATQMCKIFAIQNNKPIATLRLFSVYGPLEEPTRFAPTIITNVLHSAPIQLTPGKQRRDFVYIKDVVGAYHATLMQARKLSGEIINIGTGHEYTNDEVVKHLFAVSKQKTHIQKGAYPKRSWDTPHWVADITKARRLLGWTPKYTLDKGLKDMYAWYAKNEKTSKNK